MKPGDYVRNLKILKLVNEGKSLGEISIMFSLSKSGAAYCRDKAKRYLRHPAKANKTIDQLIEEAQT